MGHCVALPWGTKTGFWPPAACAGLSWPGSLAWSGGGGSGIRCTVAGDGPPVVTADLWTVRGRVRNWCWSSLPGNPRCCCVRVCQAPVLTRGSGGRRALSHRWGVPLQEVAGLMKVLYERVAGIDVHKDMTAPRGALLYSRFSREEFGGYSWV